MTVQNYPKQYSYQNQRKQNIRKDQQYFVYDKNLFDGNFLKFQKFKYTKQKNYIIILKISQLGEGISMTNKLNKTRQNFIDKAESINKLKEQFQNFEETLANNIIEFLLTKIKNPITGKENIEKIAKQYLINEIKNKMTLILSSLKKPKITQETLQLSKIQKKFKQMKIKYPNMQKSTAYKEINDELNNFSTKWDNCIKPTQNVDQLLISMEMISDIYLSQLKKIENDLPFFKFNSKKEALLEAKQKNEQYFKIRLELRQDQILQNLNKFLNKILAAAFESGTQNETYVTDYQVEIQKIFNHFKQKNAKEQQDLTKLAKEEQYHLQEKQQVDVAIIMNTNHNMKSFLEKAKKHFRKIQEKFRVHYPTSSIRFAFISYRDHSKQKVNDEAGLKICDFNTSEDIQKQIQKIYTGNGGNDQADAVFDGLLAVKKLKWRTKSDKFAFLIFDSPPHGKQFSNYNDNFPEGCPCGITLSEITKYYNENYISLHLKICGKKIGYTSYVFQQKFKHFTQSEVLQYNNFLLEIEGDMTKKIKKEKKNQKYFLQFNKDILKRVQHQLPICDIITKKLQITKNKVFLKLRKQHLQKLTKQMEYTDLPVQLKVQDEINKVVASLLPQQNRSYTEKVTEDIISLFKNKQKDTATIKNAINAFNQKFLIYQTKIVAPPQIQLQNKTLKQRIIILQKQIRKKLGELEESVYKRFNENTRNFIKEKEKEFSLLKSKIRFQKKVIFEEGENLSCLQFSGQQLDIARIKEIINTIAKDNSYLKLSVNKIEKLRGGAASTFNIKVQIDLKQRLNEVHHKIVSILEIVKDKSENQFVYKIAKQYFEETKVVFEAFLRQKNEISQVLLFPNGVNRFSNLQIDLSIVMDTTGSMNHYLDQAKADSSKMIQKIKEIYTNSSIKYAFVSYKDHCDSEVVQFFDFDTPKNIQNRIKNVVATGGGDTHQAVFDGLDAVKQLKWRKQSFKFVFLVFDAPPHGKQYGDYSDDHPGGCPCGKSLQNITDFYHKKNIYLNLMKYGDILQKTQQIFKKAFNQQLFSGPQGNNEHYSMSQIIINHMKKKLSRLQESVNARLEQFSNITNQIIKKIKQQIQKIIKEEQQLKALQQYQKDLKQLKKSLYSQALDKARQTSMSIKPLSKDAKIKNVQEKWAQLHKLNSLMNQTMRNPQIGKDKKK